MKQLFVAEYRNVISILEVMQGQQLLLMRYVIK